MSNLLNFKFGLHENLASQDLNAGTVYVTTDEQALYLDLPESSATDAKLKRIRIGDIIVKESARTAEPPFATGAFYYFVAENALLRWDGSAWKQLNADTDLTDVTTTIDNEVARSTGKDNEHDAAIEALQDAIKNYVLTTTFEEFKTANSSAIADAKKAGTDAQTTADKAVRDAAAAQSTADAATTTANAALPLSGAKSMTGNLDMGSHKIINVVTPSADTDAANKAYVDAAKTEANNNANTALVRANQAYDFADAVDEKADTAQNTADGAVRDAAAAQQTANQAVNAAAVADEKAEEAQADINAWKTAHTNDYTNGQIDAKIKVASDAAASAQQTADGAVRDAAAAQQTAEQGVSNAAAALAKANEMLPLAGGTMTGSINMGGQQITNLAAPTASAHAATKEYVDNKASGLSGRIDNLSTTLDSVQTTANGALQRSGGEMSGELKMGGNKITNVATPTEATDAANMSYVDSAIAAGIKANDAMTFKGTLGGTDATVSTLPATAQKGDTYKVAKADSYNNIDAKIGDLFINNADDDAAANWVHVSSGYEAEYIQTLIADTTTVYLTDGVNDTVGQAVNGIKFVGSANSNLQLTVSTADNIHTVTASMIWGTF